MNLENINRLVFEAMETIAPIETARVSMFSIDNQYNHPPFFRFRFKNIDKNDPIYTKIMNSISLFKGNLKWKCSTVDYSNNYIIYPCILDTYDESDSINKKERYIAILGENLYYKKIDDCINDIPELAKAIGSIHRS